jgi:signal transduction histidine kinase
MSLDPDAPSKPGGRSEGAGQPPDVPRQAHERTLRDLRERVKELNCLYSITRLAQREDLSTRELVRGIACFLRDSWQYPESACARVLAEGEEYRTEPFAKTPWAQSAPVTVGGERIGFVEVRYLEEFPPCDEGPFLTEERHLIDAAADLLGQIVSARRAKAHVARLSSELIKAQESERQRISRELHDKAAQDMSLLKIGLEALRSRYGPLPEDSRGHVDGLLGLATDIIGEIRALSYDLLPPDLEQLGLASAAFRLCEEFSARHDVRLQYFADGMNALKLDFETQINLYRIIQEALANIRKHSGARNARVRLVASHPSVLLRIEDDGAGFDPDRLPDDPSGQRRMGLLSMRERARLLQAKFELRARPGKGVRIIVETPARRHEP